MPGFSAETEHIHCLLETQNAGGNCKGWGLDLREWKELLAIHVYVRSLAGSSVKTHFSQSGGGLDLYLKEQCCG